MFQTPAATVAPEEGVVEAAGVPEAGAAAAE
jgi:hypothetical protein